MLNSKSNFFSKCVAVLLSTTMIGLTSFPTAHCIDVKMPNSTETDKSQKSYKVKEFLKNHWIISRAVSHVALDAAVIGLMFGAFDAHVKNIEKVYVGKLKEKFNVTPNVFTKKQEGLMWCWIACLEGMYKFSGVEISQEDIVRALYHKEPSYFNLLRLQGKPFGALPKDYRRSINSLNKSLRLNKAMIYFRGSKDVDALKDCIIDYYNSIGKKAFGITDNFAFGKSGNSYVLHMVNVVNITENDITIEDPQSGLSRTQNLRDFCRCYYDSGFMKNFSFIEVMSLVNSDRKMASEVHYFCNTKNSDKNSQSFSKIYY